jgi:DNA polymerase
MDLIGNAEARSALAWWLEAGVDVVVQEEPRDWLKTPELRPAAKPEVVQGPAPNVAPPSHETLTELQQWLSSTMELPLATSTARRILPHGPEQATIMLLSDAPTNGDFMAGQPIGGQAWQLTKRMLAAISIPVEEAYSASLSCFSTPGAKLTAADRESCAEIARRHIRLAKPKRLILFGGAVSKALLGKPLPTARGHVHKIEGIRTVVTFDPRDLVKQPSNKSLAWKDLLLLMEDES